jgi:hypothetical protein
LWASSAGVSPEQAHEDLLNFAQQQKELAAQELQDSLEQQAPEPVAVVVAMAEDKKDEVEEVGPELQEELAENNTLELKTGSHLKIIEGNRTCLVTDMSGFTRITRQYGIIHFASTLLKMQQLFRPLLTLYNAEEVYTEADNFIVSFENPLDALICSFHLQSVIDDYNNERMNPIFKIKIGGYGLSYRTQERIVVDTGNGKLYAQVVDEAFHLGEDVSSNNHCISESMYNALVTDHADSLACFAFQAQQEDANHTVEGAEAITQQHYVVSVTDTEALLDLFREERLQRTSSEFDLEQLQTFLASEHGLTEKALFEKLVLH